MFHYFPSVRTPKVLKTTGHDDITIFSANWDAYSLGNYLTAMLGDTTVAFDPTDLRYYFSPSIDIIQGTTCQTYLGLPSEFTGTVEKSIIPANLSVPQSIYVYTDLSAQTIPPSGLLGIVPISVGWGELICYDNTSADTSLLCLDHQIRSIKLRLTNQNGSPLLPNMDPVDGYDINSQYPYCPPWEVGLTIDIIDHPGYGSIDRAVDLAILTENNVG